MGGGEMISVKITPAIVTFNKIKEIETFKETTYMLVCPHCGTKYYSLTTIKGRWLCYNCHYDFGPEPEKFPWRRMKVDAVKCPECLRRVKCISDNLAFWSKTPILICPECNILVAVKYKGKWRLPEGFLKFEGRSELQHVKGQRDTITLKILNHQARKENIEFKIVEPKKTVLLWVDGEAVGYFFSYKLKGQPCLGQIYVRPEFRRRGYATYMLKEWLRRNSGPVIFESPNGIAMHILEKLGLVKLEGEYYVSTGRVSFVSF